MNAFQNLCLLASKESWYWNLAFTTCGHQNFRYAFLELSRGKEPESDGWVINNANQKNFNKIGELPRGFTPAERESIISICRNANLVDIAASCKFPDWLGYLGLIIHYVSASGESFKLLSKIWAKQLIAMVPSNTAIHDKLNAIIKESYVLTIDDLEEIESALIQSKPTEKEL